jgi:hypothetical protein
MVVFSTSASILSKTILQIPHSERRVAEEKHASESLDALANSTEAASQVQENPPYSTYKKYLDQNVGN